MAAEDWNEFISFSRSERQGITVLVFLCLFSAAYRYTVPEMISRKEIARFESKLKAWEASSERTAASDSVWQSTGTAGSKYAEDQRAALPPATKSGRTAQYTASVDQNARNSARSDVPNAPALTELRINTVEAAAIIRSNLLPREIAYRLVRFREEAGGFHSSKQILDLYGMTDSMYRSVVDRVVVEPVELRKVYVNSATAEELQTHPYISKGLAKQIINFREKVKPFETSEDLLRLYFMDADLLEKVYPYISFY
jgi:DNA uptake protein ComE-like DNA-binding protein